MPVKGFRCNDTFSERYIEELLIKEVKNLGGAALKFTSPGNAGVPDRIVLMPPGKLYFVELKSSSGKQSKLQAFWQKVLERMGFKYYLINSPEGVKDFINDVTDL